MVRTEEKRKRRNEYHLEWTKKNPEKVEQYNQRFKEKHPDYATKYYKGYYQVNKKEMLEKHAMWRECNVKMDTVYFFVDKDGKIIYIGSSSRFRERISSHCTANSNLKMNAEEMVDKYKLSIILYKDFTEYNLSRDDLYYLESYFKGSTKEIIKTNAVHCNEKNLTRSKEDLIDIAINKVQYKAFQQLSRYLN